MFLEILLAILLGVTSGIFTGLIPGIHINLISLLIMSSSAFLLGITTPLSLAVFITAMAITHTFLDSIPGIYLGAPDEAQALSVLPGHRLLLIAQGHNAVVYTVIGSFFCILLALLMFPIFIVSMKAVYPIVKDYIGYALIVIMLYMILKERKLEKKMWSFIMFMMSGCLGLIVLNMPNLNQPLFPLLSGLFGFSILLLSLLQNSTIPTQNLKSPLNIKNRTIGKASVASTIVGFIAAFLPGFGSSQAAIVAQQFVGDLGDEGFLVLVGGINTANMLISIATAYSLQKARNGAIIVIKELLEVIDIKAMLFMLATALIVAGIATILAISISKIFCRVIVKVNYKVLILSIIGFITLLTLWFDAFIGLIILLTSTAVGILASQLGVGKNHLMGCLILQVILFFVL